MLHHDLGQAEESTPVDRVILLLELEKTCHFVVIKNGDQPSPVEWNLCALQYHAEVTVNYVKHCLSLHYLDMLLRKR